MEEKKVRKRTTSAKVRNRWNSNHYDRINVTIPKGYGDVFKDYCEERGTTMNALICTAIKFGLEKYQKEQESSEA